MQPKYEMGRLEDQFGKHSYWGLLNHSTSYRARVPTQYDLIKARE